ncbi:hypothetical protein [Streptomyces sp. NPDC088246]|uniref:hypothetical protein n=1 Tax=Streptomyces sp. NPDC088246 TaxID=3365842 RepID=UPI003810E893
MPSEGQTRTGEPVGEADDAYVDLFRKVTGARAQMAARALTRVLQAGAGSLVLDEHVRTWTDPDTGAEMTERRVRYLRPDWRAAAWWLVRVYSDQYGPHAKSWDQLLDELGVGQHPASLDAPDFTALAERLRRTLAQPDAELTSPLPASSP